MTETDGPTVVKRKSERIFHVTAVGRERQMPAGCVMPAGVACRRVHGRAKESHVQMFGVPHLPASSEHAAAILIGFLRGSLRSLYNLSGVVYFIISYCPTRAMPLYATSKLAYEKKKITCL